MVTLAQHQHIDRKQVARGVIGLVIRAAEFVRKPVDDGSVNGSHEVMDRQQQIHPPGCGKLNVEKRISNAPANTGWQFISKRFEPAPLEHVLDKTFFHGAATIENIAVNHLCLPHQSPEIPDKLGGMRVFFGVGIGMMHAMQNGISITT